MVGLTQEEAARLLGVSHRTILRWEHAETRIGALQAQAVRLRLTQRLLGSSEEAAKIGSASAIT